MDHPSLTEIEVGKSSDIYSIRFVINAKDQLCMIALSQNHNYGLSRQCWHRDNLVDDWTLEDELPEFREKIGPISFGPKSRPFMIGTLPANVLQKYF